MSEPINDDPEKVISLIQVLDDLNSETIHLKTEAEDLECTYELGPINQPVMVCKTCSIDPSKLPNGVCASCAQKCHEGHELLELYSKRDFTCECGTDKLNTSCKFNDRLPNPVKRERIESNFYNHNFEGLYCLCNKPYDAENDTDNMYQCHICYDWFHEKCIGIIHEDEENDLICFNCVKAYPFLLDYVDGSLIQAFPIKSNNQNDNENNNNQEESESNKDSAKDVENAATDKKPNNENNSKSSEENTATTKNEATDTKRSIDSESENIPELDNPLQKRAKNENNIETKNKSPRIDIESSKDEESCTRPEPNTDLLGKEINLFAYPGWKSKLCNCEKCEPIYFNHRINFLIEDEEIYSPPQEEVEEVTGSELFETFLEDLNEMPREQAIAFTHVIKKLGSEFTEFMRPFAEKDKVVTKEDILEFLNSRNNKEE